MTGAGEQIALIGAGSIGLMLAAHLSEAGCDIVVCGRDPLDRVVMNIDGDIVEHKVNWVAEPAALPPVRYAVVATKIHQTPDVAGWLGALPADSVLLAAQNGVDHRDRLTPLTAAAVVPTLVYTNCERTAPGHVRVRRTGRGLVVPDDDASRAAAALFAGCELTVENVTDFTTALWAKLLTNVIANPVTALTGRGLGVFAEPGAATLGFDLAAEAVAVGRAEGAALTLDDARQTLTWLQSLPAATPSSMLQDRLAGRPMEHGGLLGPVVTLGRRHGIATPLTSAMLSLLDALAHNR